jgi:hypothetical protein
MFLPANTTSLIQPCDQGNIRVLIAHNRREVRARIISELDDIPDLSDASAVANTFSFLDEQHLVAKSRKQSRRKILKTASENLEFLKDTGKPA